MQTIEIDFDVFKALTLKRESESVTYNDVIRQLLNLELDEQDNSNDKLAQVWVSKGVSFPVGTEFRVRYKGEMHFGEVEKNGLMVNGTLASSPSDAAHLITGNNVNGWRFWECKFPGHSRWSKIDNLRS